MISISRYPLFTRFISNAVMIGFFTGVATVLILGQLGDLTGFSSSYTNKVAQAVDLLFNLDQVDIPSLLTGLATIRVSFSCKVNNE